MDTIWLTILTNAANDKIDITWRVKGQPALMWQSKHSGCAQQIFKRPWFPLTSTLTHWPVHLHTLELLTKAKPRSNLAFGTGPYHCHLWEWNLDRGDSLIAKRPRKWEPTWYFSRLQPLDHWGIHENMDSVQMSCNSGIRHTWCGLKFQEIIQAKNKFKKHINNSESMDLKLKVHWSI